MPVDLLTTKEAAALLKVKPACLEARRWKGEPPPFLRIGARIVRYRREDLERWFHEARRTSTSDPGPFD
jgi:hypothetical protein